MRSEEEEFGVLIGEADGTGGEKGESPSYSEDSVKRRAIQMCALSERRRPMKKAVSRDMVRLTLHINTETEVGERGRGIFKVSVPQFAIVGFPVEVGIVANHLRKICIRWAT